MPIAGDEYLGNAARSLSVPERRQPSGFCLACKDTVNLLPEAAQVVTDQDICAQLHGHWALRAFPKGETRHSQARGFLLNAAGIGNDQPGVPFQGEKVQVTEGIKQKQCASGLSEPGVQSRTSPGVHGKDEGKIAADFLESVEDFEERRFIIHIGRAM